MTPEQLEKERQLAAEYLRQLQQGKAITAPEKITQGGGYPPASLTDYTRLVEQHNPMHVYSNNPKLKKQALDERHQMYEIREALGPNYERACAEIWNANLTKWDETLSAARIPSKELTAFPPREHGWTLMPAPDLNQAQHYATRAEAEHAYLTQGVDYYMVTTDHYWFAVTDTHPLRALAELEEARHYPSVAQESARVADGEQNQSHGGGMEH